LRGGAQEPFLRATECAAFKQTSALLIVLNFALNIAQYEMLPDPDSFLYLLFDRIDMAFTLVTASPILPLLAICNSAVPGDLHSHPRTTICKS
jgi:hypothetical protein